MFLSDKVKTCSDEVLVATYDTLQRSLEIVLKEMNDRILDKAEAHAN